MSCTDAVLCVLPGVLCCSLVSSEIAKLYFMCSGAVLCGVLCLSVVFCGVLICREMEELSDVDGPIIRSGEAQQCDKFSKLFYCHHHHPHPHHPHHYSYKAVCRPVGGGPRFDRQASLQFGVTVPFYFI